MRKFQSATLWTFVPIVVIVSIWNQFMSSTRNSQMNFQLKGFNGVIVRGRIQQKHEYSNVHASVEPLNRVASSKKPTSSDKTPRPNVLILGIDSVSRSNVIRNLPLSYRYLTEHVGGWDFRCFSIFSAHHFLEWLDMLTRVIRNMTRQLAAVAWEVFVVLTASIQFAYMLRRGQQPAPDCTICHCAIACWFHGRIFLLAQ